MPLRPRASLALVVLALVTTRLAAQDPPNPTATPAATLSFVPCDDATCDRCAGFDFSKVPPARPLQRVGLFPLPSTGPGYYSVLDYLKGTWRDNPPRSPFPPMFLSPLSFYDADWRFIDEPGYVPDALDRLKRVRICDNWLVSTGGQAWFRYQNEYNARLLESNNVDMLVRTRPYLDVWYRDRLRFFVEGIFADSLWHDVVPLGTDIDRADFQNLFGEAKLGELAGKPVYARVGRQEVSLGSLRLVAVPDWANTRRTFDGGRLYRAGEKWDVDLFWLQPVFPRPSQLNYADHQQNLAGAFVTYKPRKGAFLDLYYLMLDSDNVVKQIGIERAPFTVHTIGGRYIGDRDNRFLYESEGAIQLGRRGPSDVVAGMYTGGLGYRCAGLPWNPTFWTVYNYTSGDNDPGAGSYHTFHQLFPFVPYYMGWGDTVGRQNNHDLNLRLYLYPTKFTTIWVQYHHFWLAAARDALYNSAGVAYRRDPTGKAGTDVGQKIEFLTNIHMTKRTDFFFGYSYLLGGNFLQNTSGPIDAVNSSIFFLGTSCRW